MTDNWKFKALVGLLVCWCGCEMAAGQDWPQWRGANRDGRIVGAVCPERWPEALSQRWSLEVGKGDGTPLLVGGRLYCFTRQEPNEVVWCLNPADGEILWQAGYPANLTPSGPSAKHSGPWSTPVIADGKLYTLGLGGILSCFNAVTGAEIWRKQSNEDYQGIEFNGETAMSPLVEDGLCVVQIGRKTCAIFAFEKESGAIKWRWDSDGSSFSSPVIMMAGGVKQLVTFTAKKLVGLALADGRLLWQMDYEAYQGNNTTPVVDGSTLILTGQSKGLSAVRIDRQGELFTVTPLWTNKPLSARFTTPVLKDGLLYGFNGAIFCANVQDGNLVWQDPARRGPSASVLDGGEALWVLTYKGELVAFKPAGTEFHALGVYKVAEPEVWTHPIIAGKRIYIKDDLTLSLWSMD